MVYAPRSRSILRLGPLDNTNGLVGWWTFDDGQAYDTSGAHNHGIEISSPLLVGGIVKTSINAGALNFNGTTHNVQTTINNGSASTLTSLTLSAWFKTSIASGKEIFGLNQNQDGSSATNDRAIYIGSDGKIYGYVFDTGAKYAVSTATYNDGNWHLATLSIKAGTSSSLYVDALLNQATTIATPYTGYSASYWLIGKNSNGAARTNAVNGTFSGSIDDVRIYNRALTGAEINSLYNSAFMPWMEAETPALYASAAAFPWWAAQNNPSVIGAGVY